MKIKSFLFRIISLFVLFGFNPVYAAPQDIYSDALGKNWLVNNWGCSTQNLRSQPADRVGNYALQVTESCAWGGFGFEKRTANWQTVYYIAVNEYATIEFDIKPITSGALTAGCISKYR